MDIASSVATVESRGGVVLRGYLTKRGEKVKNWKKRWFVLTTNPAPTLYYFKKEDSIQESGKVHLDASTLARPTYTGDKKHMMELVTPNRTYLFSDSPENLEKWMSALNSLTGRKLHTLSDPQQASDELEIPSDTPLSKMIKDSIQACKAFNPAMQQYIALANKYQSKLNNVTECGAALASLTYHIGAAGAVETATGKELCKIGTALQACARRKNEMRSVLIDKLVVRFQRSIDEDKKALDALEKKVMAQVHQVAKETNKAKNALTKAKKKKNQNQLAQAQKNLDTRLTMERHLLEGALTEVLAYQETRQQELLHAWTHIIDALASVVDEEAKLVAGNARWRNESTRPIDPVVPDQQQFGGYEQQQQQQQQQQQFGGASSLPPPSFGNADASFAPGLGALATDESVVPSSYSHGGAHQPPPMDQQRQSEDESVESFHYGDNSAPPSYDQQSAAPVMAVPPPMPNSAAANVAIPPPMVDAPAAAAPVAVPPPMPSSNPARAMAIPPPMPSW